MVDRVTEIREALAGLFALEYDEDEQEWDAQEVNPQRLWKVLDAARAYADLLDSDTLIIRRDENGAWPEWALRATLTRPREWQVEVLDSLASSQGVEPLLCPGCGRRKHINECIGEVVEGVEPL